ncbi:hypothetical protein [Actinoplanes sp. TFC3]|uniref:hypothetical protein n=1 Tax=Actinoplanes sp. TFC3 TaxID=1710355 RepID=UPI00128FFD31|nr:hypothetical protein [Actinoplanes sp. TFC3]
MYKLRAIIAISPRQHDHLSAGAVAALHAGHAGAVSVSVSFNAVWDRSPGIQLFRLRSSWTMAIDRERRLADLESVLGSHPHEFESRILRQLS